MATRRRSQVFQDRAVPTIQVLRATVEDRQAIRRKNERQVARHRADQEKRAARRREAKPKNFVVPRRDHDGKTFVCFASGPGLTPEVVETVRPYVERGQVIAAGLNDTYRIVPYLQEFYACDQHWWKYHLKNPQNGRHVLDSQPDCRIWGNQTAAATLNQHPRINIVQGKGGNGFHLSPEMIHWGNNSGYQLLNLCYHLGAAKMLLCGYNMGVPKNLGAKGHHFFGPHPKPMSQSAAYHGFVRQYHTIQGNIKEMIVNCTPDSKLDCFQKMELEEALTRFAADDDSAEVCG